MAAIALEGLASVDAIASRVMERWRPPPRMRLSEWADKHFYLSAESAAEPGRWRTLPYQRGPMDACTDPRVYAVTLMKSARVGYTKMLNAAIGFHMHHDPCAMMLIQPTLVDAKGYSKEEIAPMLRDCPDLSAIADGPGFQASLLHMVFPGGLLQLVGARSPASFRRVSRRVVFGDEVDGYPPSAGEEGDPISLATRRTEYFWNRKLVWGSTPTIAGASRIEMLFAAGDQRRFFVACPHCDHKAPFVFRRDVGEESGAPPGHFMDWPSGTPEEAHFVCQSCGCVIEERLKRTMISEADRRQLAGESGIGWVAHAPFNGHASFHVWAAYSYSPNATWAQLAREYEQSEGKPEQRKTYVNTVLGETWKDDGEAPDWEVLYNRRDTYRIGTCPWGVLFLTAGVDVQRDRLIYEVVGWGRDKRSWSIDVDIIPGDPSDLTAHGPWPRIDALLDRTFLHASGVELRIHMLAVDSSDNTQSVYSWARQHPLSRVIAVKGVSRAGVLIGAPSKVDVTVSGKRRGYRMWPVSVNVAKSELYGWLKLKAPTDEARADGAVDPPGYCRWPQYGEWYFRQLVAEKLVPTRTPHGFLVYEWTLPPDKENHTLDLRNYARAAASLAGIDRFGDRDWRRLEGVVGQAPPNVAATATSEAGPESARGAAAAAAAATKPTTPKPTRRQSWIRRPVSGWIGRNR